MIDPQTIRSRAALTRDLRAFFDAEGFVEVETPLLSREVCVDAYIDPITTGDGRFLQPSPELAMKRLLCDERFAAGCPAIWQLGKAFRHGETGSRHHPEFTMCEWYQVGDSHIEQMALTESLVDAMHRSAVSTIDPPPQPYARVRYDDALVAALRDRLPDKAVPDQLIAPGDTAHAITTETIHLIATATSSHGYSTDPATFDSEGWLDVAMVELIEPWLTRFPAVFLTDYPATQAALATINEAGTADRFELYLRRGDSDLVELANGYNELAGTAANTDRMVGGNSRRRDPLPRPERFLADVDRLPPCSGVALGWDRLVMHLLGLESLADATVTDID